MLLGIAQTPGTNDQKLVEGMIKATTVFLTEYFMWNFSIYLKVLAYHVLINSKSNTELIEMEVNLSSYYKKYATELFQTLPRQGTFESLTEESNVDDTLIE